MERKYMVFKTGTGLLTAIILIPVFAVSGFLLVQAFPMLKWFLLPVFLFISIVPAWLAFKVDNYCFLKRKK